MYLTTRTEREANRALLSSGEVKNDCLWRGVLSNVAVALLLFLWQTDGSTKSKKWNLSSEVNSSSEIRDISRSLWYLIC